MFRSFSKVGARVRRRGANKVDSSVFYSELGDRNEWHGWMHGWVGVDSSCEAGVDNCDE